MSFQTGATIIIRGKGSVKDWHKKKQDGKPIPGEDEPLHVFISSTNPEAVKKAEDKIRNLIKELRDMPEDQNKLGRSSCI